MATSSWRESPPFSSQTLLTPLCHTPYQPRRLRRCTHNFLDPFPKTEIAKHDRLSGSNNRKPSAHGAEAESPRRRYCGFLPRVSPLLIDDHPLTVSPGCLHTTHICTRPASSHEITLCWIGSLCPYGPRLQPCPHSDTLRVGTCDVPVTTSLAVHLMRPGVI